ncbi:aminomethyltransferase family protein [Kosakonia sp. BYX6]|uniref:Aminomethyltransferase family protein n=1 Tax=Kosakonia calanthes TaxID=3139408 RepID=A0ABZ3B2J5_9ENTR
MKSLHDLHLSHNAQMGVYNNRTVPAVYNDAIVEYKAVRENALLVDYSHMSIISVMGDDAWALVNHMASADISIIRDEQGMYSLVLREDGSIRGDIYTLCTPDGYYIISENIPASEIIACLSEILERAEEMDILEIPEIKSMEHDDWGAIMLEGPYSWEILAEVYGFDIIGLPYHEYINQDDGLLVFRCGKHGEFAYMVLGQQTALVELWANLLDKGEKFLLKTGGLEYQNTVRIENTSWDETIYANYSRNPVELQMQWAVQYDKEDFIGKSMITELSQENAKRKLIGIRPLVECAGIAPDDQVLVGDKEVGIIVKSVYSPALQSFIALALIEQDYAWSDIEGFDIHTAAGNVSAKTQSVPFLYNLSMLVSPTEHSYIDCSKARHAS